MFARTTPSRCSKLSRDRMLETCWIVRTAIAAALRRGRRFRFRNGPLVLRDWKARNEHAKPQGSSWSWLKDT
eukprot:scaffold180_cov311-Pinguiococcus_pyrenoidosus.AAC.14